MYSFSFQFSIHSLLNLRVNNVVISCKHNPVFIQRITKNTDKCSANNNLIFEYVYYISLFVRLCKGTSLAQTRFITDFHSVFAIHIHIVRGKLGSINWG